MVLDKTDMTNPTNNSGLFDYLLEYLFIIILFI